MLKPFLKGPLSVKELSIHLRQLIRESFPFVSVYGEISNLRKAGTLTYFTLKDSDSQISVVVFNTAITHALREGQSIVVNGTIDLYLPVGRYQIIAKHIQPVGLGFLQQQLESLKAKLQAEGLFSTEKKLPLPILPKTIGLITSPDTAAFHDFIKILQRQRWKGKILLSPSLVQGHLAPGNLIRAFNRLQAFSEIEIIIIIRGGGSFEDLNCFNQEKLIRVLAKRKKPIVTGIGHEIDTTLCDFVADHRAETPTAAAQFIAESYTKAKVQVFQQQKGLCQWIQFLWYQKHQRLQTCKQRLQSHHPQKDYLLKKALHQQLRHRLKNACETVLQRKIFFFQQYQQRLLSLPILQRLKQQNQHLEHAKQRLNFLFEKKYLVYEQQQKHLTRRLELLSVTGQLKRGILFPLSNDGKLLQDFVTFSNNSTLNVLHRSGKYCVRIVEKFGD